MARAIDLLPSNHAIDCAKRLHRGNETETEHLSFTVTDPRLRGGRWHGTFEAFRSCISLLEGAMHGIFKSCISPIGREGILRSRSMRGTFYALRRYISPVGRESIPQTDVVTLCTLL